jgi:hypothetical protein
MTDMAGKDGRCKTAGGRGSYGTMAEKSREKFALLTARTVCQVTARLGTRSRCVQSDGSSVEKFILFDQQERPRGKKKDKEKRERNLPTD